MITSVGSGSQLEQEFRRLSPRLWRSVLVYAGGRTDVAEEAVAEAFARALASRTEIRDLEAWLYRVAFRVAAREMTVIGRSVSISADQAVASSPESGEFEELFAALEALPANQRTSVFLHYHHDLSVAEIGDRLGVSASTVRVHLWRGRRRLRQLLGGDVRDE